MAPVVPEAQALSSDWLAVAKLRSQEFPGAHLLARYWRGQVVDGAATGIMVTEDQREVISEDVGPVDWDRIDASRDPQLVRRRGEEILARSAMASAS